MNYWYNKRVMKKLDEVTKVKLIYSGELVFFAIVFIVLGILQMVDVIVLKEGFLNVFKFLTLVGAAYFIYDFVTSFTNKKKREKVCFVDKFSTIFIPPYVITLDILLFSNNEFVWDNPKFFIAPLFFALAAVYIFQGIYHWFYPLKELFEDDEPKAEEAKDSEVKEEPMEENNNEIEKNS